MATECDEVCNKLWHPLQAIFAARSVPLCDQGLGTPEQAVLVGLGYVYRAGHEPRTTELAAYGRDCTFSSVEEVEGEEAEICHCSYRD